MRNELRHESLDGLPGAGLISGYRPVEGVADEMLDAAGHPRPAWRRLIAALGAIGPEDLAHRFARADHYLRDAGVYYRIYSASGAKERAWPLSHIPLLIEDAEWTAIAAGLKQRAELLEEIVADIYGENRLVARGLLPPHLIAANPEFLRPMVGARPAGGHFLHFCAFDLGRAPDGQWWVLGDRAQAPSGAGFALENRVATVRALPDIHGDMNVHRLAGFFRDFRDRLLALSGQTPRQAAILTPGQHNETYFEHTYIARYLGFMLLEGGDLTVADGRLLVRTVSGLKPIDVMWRRMDAAFADPLEFRTDSRIGTPGLAEALRNGAAVMVNALGSGIVETRALLAFIPSICRALRGEKLDLPNIATWWCGPSAERRHVIEHLDHMVIGPALSTRLAFEDSQESRLGADLDGPARARMIERLEANGTGWVGQESVSLSTTPAYIDGRLEPRPVTLRAFAARTAAGWTILPGGFARIGRTQDTAAIAMQRGGRAADVWVLGSKPVEKVTLLPKEGGTFTRGMPGELPSRAADNLFWLGRYAERSEGLIRILRAYHARLAEADKREPPLLADVKAYLLDLGVDCATPIPDALESGIARAVASAGRIRDRFSPDGWLALNDLATTIHRFRGMVTAGDDATRAMTVLLRKLAGFAGLVHENMYRFSGWRLLEIGRRLERGIQTASIVSRLTRPEAPDGALEILLEIGDSVMTHRRRYNVNSGRLTALDLLILDNFNPRSVAFQVLRMKEEIGLLPAAAENGQLSPLSKAVLRLDTQLATTEPHDLSTETLDGCVAAICGISELLAQTYFG